MRNIPFTLVPLILFNIAAFTFIDSWNQRVLGVTMFSGVPWELTFSDVMIVIGLFALFAEIISATTLANRAIGNHLVSILVLIIYVIEFVVVERAAQSVFFILTIIALIDVLAGVVITIRLASRDVSFERPTVVQ